MRARDRFTHTYDDALTMKTSVYEDLCPLSYIHRTELSGNTLCAGSAMADREVLRCLFEATGGESWTNQRGWATNEDVDGWFGVTTNIESRVVRLDLRHNNLRGKHYAEILPLGIQVESLHKLEHAVFINCCG